MQQIKQNETKSSKVTDLSRRNSDGRRNHSKVDFKLPSIDCVAGAGGRSETKSDRSVRGSEMELA